MATTRPRRWQNHKSAYGIIDTPDDWRIMNIAVAALLLVLGLLLALVWGVHLVVQILGWILVVVAVVWLVSYLTGNRTRT